MSIIVALFIGLSVSAEEIFRDRKILKRESFLNLSRSGYILSKIVILFGMSGLQTLLFVLIGNSILGIKGLYLDYWLILFSVACFANVLGLNISASFDTAVTIYILIPLLVIPQMILGGAMFSFDKLNDKIGGNPSTSPAVADIMVSRWAYEALSVTQFKNNRYERLFYNYDRLESMANYKQVYYIPEMLQILDESAGLCGNDADRPLLDRDLALLRNELGKESAIFSDLSFGSLDKLTVRDFNPEMADRARSFLKQANERYVNLLNNVSNKRNEYIRQLYGEFGGEQGYLAFYNDQHNEFLADLLTKKSTSDKIRREGDRLVQIIDPIYFPPSNRKGISLRAHFYSPVKYTFGFEVSTLCFNLLIIWIFTGLLYLTLYYDVLKKLIHASGRIIPRGRLNE